MVTFKLIAYTVHCFIIFLPMSSLVYQQLLTPLLRFHYIIIVDLIVFSEEIQQLTLMKIEKQLKKK